MADNPEEKITLKVFHPAIQNDHAAIKIEEDDYQPIPISKTVSFADVQANYQRIKEDILEIFKT